MPRRHFFSAEASFANGIVDQAGAIQTIADQGLVKLLPNGGSADHPPTPFNFPALISIGAGITHVSGVHVGGTWTTVATSVVDDVDICDGVITADQIMAKITTIYPAVGYVPAVSFQGTQFTNLKINGAAVTPALNLGICSPQPLGDQPYITDPGFLGRAKAEYNNIAGAVGVPPWLKNDFQWNPGRIQSLDRVDCSLVTGVAGFPGQSFGHVLLVPGFGNVFLGELGVSNHFEITMLRVELTQRGQTEVRAVALDSQGHTMP